MGIRSTTTLTTSKELTTGVPVSDTVVEKYEPDLSEAEDGTEYSKVTIIIEDSKGTTTITAGKASFLNAEVKSESYLPMDKAFSEFYPEVTQIDFRFRPHTTDEFPAIIIERNLHNG